MKTLAQLKRDLQVGTKVKTIYNGCKTGYQVGTIREISKVQCNSIALKTLKENGEYVDSWLDYPKASMTEYVDNQFKFFDGPNKWNNNTKTLMFIFEIIKEEA